MPLTSAGLRQAFLQTTSFQPTSLTFSSTRPFFS